MNDRVEITKIQQEVRREALPSVATKRALEELDMFDSIADMLASRHSSSGPRDWAK